MSQDIYEERRKALEALKKSMDEYAGYGRNYALKNREYKILRRQEILRLKAKGYPVTVILQLAKGEEHVANAEFEMLVAEALYKAHQENINVQKLILKSLEEEIKREWNA